MHFSTLELPKIIKVDDYHEFDDIAELLVQLGGSKIKVEEIGFEAPKYVGIVYQHKDKDYYQLTEEYSSEDDSE